MKRTIIAVISIVLIAFAFTACRQSVVIPFDPMPGNPNTPSGPSVPDYTIQVGDKTYQYLDDAIEAAPNGAIVEIGSGEFRIGSSIAITKNLTITGAGIDKTTITVPGGRAFTVTGDSFKISNLTISDESSDLTALRSVINIGSTKATVDSVKITGGYSSTTENFGIVGIITNQNTESVTITNSRFEGFRVPIETDNDLANGAFAALIKGNTFEDFDKVTFEYREEGVTIEDNTFVLDSDTDKSFQISLDWKNGTITPEQAKAVAEANDCVVQVLRTGQSYDAEGAVISTVDQLEAFATGNAGSKARLTEGTFQLGSTISMTSDISIVGAGKDETILEVNGFGAFDVSGSNASISNLTISDKANVETSTKRRLIDVHSSKIVIDNVKLKGQYSTAVSGTPPQDHGIVTDKKVSDVTITNSDFIGIRMPISLDFDGVSAYTATVSGNTFDKFEKLSFSNFNESSMSISNNKFVTSTKNFQIELFGAGATAEAAMNIAKENNCIVQLGVDDTNYNGDGKVTNE